MLENCEKIRPLISEYIDGLLPVTKADYVKAHLDRCQECSKLANAFQVNKSALKGLSARHTSPEFDARLALKIAELRKEHKITWWQRLLLSAPSNRVLRPVLAAAISVIVVGSYMSIPKTQINPPNRTIGTTKTSPDSAALIAHCVEQHQNYAETQPLSDWSAQNLDSQTDAGYRASGGNEL